MKSIMEPTNLRSRMDPTIFNDKPENKKEIGTIFDKSSDKVKEFPKYR